METTPNEELCASLISDAQPTGKATYRFSEMRLGFLVPGRCLHAHLGRVRWEME